jgi:hypothetical protein
VSIHSSRLSSADAVSSKVVKGTRPPTSVENSRTWPRPVNIGSISRSGPSASTASISSALPGLSGLTRTISRLRRSGRADARHVGDGVLADERVTAGLPFGLAQPLEVDEEAHAIERVATAGERHVVGDLEQVEHGGGNYRRRAARTSLLRQADSSTTNAAPIAPRSVPIQDGNGGWAAGPRLERRAQARPRPRPNACHGSQRLRGRAQRRDADDGDQQLAAIEQVHQPEAVVPAAGGAGQHESAAPRRSR